MPNPQERLKILVNSSTPIVVMETVEEVRAIKMARSVCAELDLPLFEWSIADGLVRSGGSSPRTIPDGKTASPRVAMPDQAQPAIVNTREPAQVLAHLETMTIDAVVVLKDFHRHVDDPVVVRRLRDVAQQFSANRRTVV